MTELQAPPPPANFFLAASEEDIGVMFKPRATETMPRNAVKKRTNY